MATIDCSDLWRLSGGVGDLYDAWQESLYRAGWRYDICYDWWVH